MPRGPSSCLDHVDCLHFTCREAQKSRCAVVRYLHPPVATLCDSHSNLQLKVACAVLWGWCCNTWCKFDFISLVVSFVYSIVRSVPSFSVLSCIDIIICVLFCVDFGCVLFWFYLFFVWFGSVQLRSVLFSSILFHLGFFLVFLFVSLSCCFVLFWLFVSLLDCYFLFLCVCLNFHFRENDMRSCSCAISSAWIYTFRSILVFL